MRTVGLEKLGNDIVRPDIEKHLVPLALYRGNTSLGRIQAKWNFAIAMMHSECETFGEGVKLSNNPDFAHLCPPHTNVQHLTILSFFSRLGDHPRVTDNVSGLTEYVRMLNPWKGVLIPVPEEDKYRRTKVPWRTWGVPQKRAWRPYEPKPSEILYPFVIHKPKVKDDAYDLMLLVNSAVPKALPDHIRADICQDLIVDILAGDISRDELAGRVRGYARKVLEMHPIKYGHMSLDQPLYAGDNRTLADLIAAPDGYEEEHEYELS